MTNALKYNICGNHRISRITVCWINACFHYGCVLFSNNSLACCCIFLLMYFITLHSMMMHCFLYIGDTQENPAVWLPQGSWWEDGGVCRLEYACAVQRQSHYLTYAHAPALLHLRCQSHAAGQSGLQKSTVVVGVCCW